jgi:hypothetical protein
LLVKKELFDSDGVCRQTEHQKSTSLLYFPS